MWKKGIWQNKTWAEVDIRGINLKPIGFASTIMNRPRLLIFLKRPLTRIWPFMECIDGNIVPHSKLATTEVATNRNGHKLWRPQTEKPQTELPQTKTTTDRNVYKPKRPQTEKAPLHNTSTFCMVHWWFLCSRMCILKTVCYVEVVCKYIINP